MYSPFFLKSGNQIQNQEDDQIDRQNEQQSQTNFDNLITKVYISQSSQPDHQLNDDHHLKKNNSLISITSSNISHLTVNNSTKTKYDMFVDDEEHRSSCESGNYNEEFSSTRNLIKENCSETGTCLDDADDNEEDELDHQKFTSDQLDSFILNPNRQLNTNEPEYFISNRDSRINYENDIDDEYRQNESSSDETSSQSSYDEFEEADSSENSDCYEYSDSDQTDTDQSSSEDDLNNDLITESSTMQLIKKKTHQKIINDSQFVGHFDGNKPLLEDENDEEEKLKVIEKPQEGKLVDIDDGEENLLELKNDSINYSLTDLANKTDQLLNQSHQSNSSNLSIQSQEEDELDKEVAVNLLKQVEQDKLRKDLFGSAPFNQEAREALKCKLNLNNQLDNSKLNSQEIENLFEDNQFNKMNLEQIKQQISSKIAQQPQNPQPVQLQQQTSVGPVGAVDSSTLSLIASTLLENQEKVKKEDKYQSVKLPNVCKKQQVNKSSEQLTIDTATSSNLQCYDEMPSPSTIFSENAKNQDSKDLKIIYSTKSSKLPSSLRHKDEKHEKHNKAKVKLHKSKLKNTHKNYKFIEEYDDDVDELLSNNEQDDLSQITSKKSLNKDEKSKEKSSKKKSKDRLGLPSITSKVKDKEKLKEKKLKKEKKHKDEKDKDKKEKRLKKESKKSSKSSSNKVEESKGFFFSNMSFEDTIEDKLEETRC